MHLDQGNLPQVHPLLAPGYGANLFNSVVT